MFDLYVVAQVGTADIEEGAVDIHRHSASMALANGRAQEEPAGLGPGSEALAQMQNLHKVQLSLQSWARASGKSHRVLCYVVRKEEGSTELRSNVCYRYMAGMWRFTT